MRLPYLRKAAPDVLATARAQRWDPAEVLRVLIGEEVVGRDAATRRMRRQTAAFPTGKTLASWHDSRGLPTWRRSTATSWRRTSSSAVLASSSPVRDASQSNTCTDTRYSNRTNTNPIIAYPTIGQAHTRCDEFWHGTGQSFRPWW
jgi:hypothetical protein